MAYNKFVSKSDNRNFHTFAGFSKNGNDLLRSAIIVGLTREDLPDCIGANAAAEHRNDASIAMNLKYMLRRKSYDIIFYDT
jgi:hypothetical protein